MEVNSRFEPVTFKTQIPFSELHRETELQLTPEARDLSRVLFGQCVIDVPRKNPLIVFLDEVLNPFYVFQVYAICVFLWSGYDKYAYLLIAL